MRGLDASGRAADQIRFRYDLAGFYAHEGRLLESLAVVEALGPHVPESEVLENARRGLRASIELSELVVPRGSQLQWPIHEVPLDWAAFDPRIAKWVERLSPETQLRKTRRAHV